MSNTKLTNEIMKASIKNVIRTNWKNRVRFYFEGSTLSELKAFVKMQIEKENKSYQEFLIRKSPEFKDAVTNKLYN